MQILKQFNAKEYCSSQKKLRPHGKLISKLANPKVRYHEKRKTLKKSQLGEGFMNLAKTLIIPLMERGIELLSKGQLKQFIWAARWELMLITTIVSVGDRVNPIYFDVYTFFSYLILSFKNVRHFIIDLKIFVKMFFIAKLPFLCLSTCFVV